MRKYIGPVKSDNFIYPNNVLEEYDVEIIHDINNNSVSGTTSGFSAVYSGGSIACSFTYIWSKNGAEPFINEFGDLQVLSIHMLAPGQDYYKPFRTVASVSNITTTATTVTDTYLFFVSPAQMGLTGFTSGVYNFEIRFIGQKAIYPICQSASVVVPTPTPTPTPTNTGPTPTPGGETPTPTPSSTPSIPCVCVEIVVTGATPGPEPVLAGIEYNNCYSVLTVDSFATNGTRYRCMDYTGGVIQVFSSNGLTYSIAPGGYNCYDGTCPTDIVITPTPTPTPTAGGPTPTPTPTATSVPPTATPTPTATGEPATPTPTPTATATATPTPTATPVPPDCVTSVSFEVDEAGNVTYTDCCGTPVTNFYGIGPQVINDCIEYGTVSGTGALISFITYGVTSCTCVTPTPTSTATPTPTPTATGEPATPTPTPTPTAGTFYTYYIGADNASRENACSFFEVDFQTEVYADTNAAGSVSRFFVDTNLVTPFIGSGDWYAWRLGVSGPATHGGQVSSGGFVTNIGAC